MEPVLEVWASIDLLEGNVVRLIRGEVGNAIVYSTKPLHVVRKLTSYGFDGFHIVDLDRALGRGSNFELIKSILPELRGFKVQLGGGMRDRESITSALTLDVDRVVLGTVLMKSPSLVRELVEGYSGDRFVAALDYDQTGTVVYNGWTSRARMRLKEGYAHVRALGIMHVLATSVANDGTLSGPDLGRLMELDEGERSITYVSGGISSVSHIRALKSLGVRGAVLGRVLYEQLVSPRSLIGAARS
ncbi:MAG: 1-(5-phosphoribosyl)-5-[(5-phosphoribosylamino)methylideneamino] imidazole-4-carboxamide isomerase [Candidatus Caldarchaeales archaeon]